MNEERKPKKLNIKKIAVVALSVIMIMATFCLSAFADNPLTNTTTIKFTDEPSFDPNGYIESFDDYYKIFIDNDEITVHAIIQNQEISIREVGLSQDTSYVTIKTDNETDLVSFTKNIDTMEWSYYAPEIKILYGTNNTTGERVSATDTANAMLITIKDIINTGASIAVQEMFYYYRVTTNQGILSTFLGIGTWIGGAVSALIGMFYLNGSLTFIGYLTVAALAVSVVFLLIYLISSFLKFRG